MEGGESEEEKNKTIPNDEHKTKNSKRTKKKRKNGKKIKKAKIWIDLNPPLSPSDASRISVLDDERNNRHSGLIPLRDNNNDIFKEAQNQLDEEASNQTDEEA